MFKLDLHGYATVPLQIKEAAIPDSGATKPLESKVNAIATAPVLSKVHTYLEIVPTGPFLTVYKSATPASKTDTSTTKEPLELKTNSIATSTFVKTRFDPCAKSTLPKLSEEEIADLSKRYEKQIKAIESIQHDPNPKKLNILYLCRFIEQSRKEKYQFAKKIQKNLHMTAKTLSLFYSVGFNKDGTVLVHFTKSSDDGHNKYGKSIANKTSEDYVVVKSCIDFDSCEEYASMSCLASKAEERVKLFSVVEDLDHFAKLKYVTESYTSANGQEKVRLIVTLGKLGNLESLPLHPEWPRNRITHDIVKGIASLHQIGYSHFDVCPKNIVITTEKRALIIDLENMKKLEDLDKRNVLNFMFTHPIADENFGPKIIALYAYVDIWALGYTLYEMHSGKLLPWDGRESFKERIKLKRSDWFLEPKDKQSGMHLIWEMVQEKPPSWQDIVSRLNSCFPIDTP